MKNRFLHLQSHFAILILVISAMFHSGVAQAAPTTEQRKELAEIKTELVTAAKLIRKKEIDKAKTIVDTAEERLDNLLEQSESLSKNRQVKLIKRLIKARRKDIEKRSGKSSGTDKGNTSQPNKKKKTSFAGEVAPILAQKCARCHGQRKSGGLRLNTFAALKAGGKSGPLLIPGNPERSRIIARLTSSNANQRMPKNAPALSQLEIETVAKWIRDGAPFDGKNENATLAELTTANKNSQRKNIKVNMAQGNEKVSFKRDIAPFMVKLCLRCHNDKQPRSDFSIETMRAIMQGGETGTVVTPGNLDESRLWDLVGKQDPVKMPQGQAVITRKNWNDLRTWINEGARYDGKNPDEKLASLVATVEANSSSILKSHTELLKIHKETSASYWRRVTGKPASDPIETDDLLIYTDAKKERQPLIEKQLQASSNRITKLLQDQQSPLVAGKLPVFVFADKFEVNEFQQLILRRPPLSVRQFSKVTANQEDAYVVLLDDKSDTSGSKLTVLATSQLTHAHLQSGRPDVPAWIGQGAGLYFAEKPVSDSQFFRTMVAQSNIRNLPTNRGDILFRSNGIAPDKSASVGYVLVALLVKRHGEKKLISLLNKVRAGQSLNEAVQEVYRADPNELIQLINTIGN